MTTATPGPVSDLVPNLEFAKLATDAQIERTAKALEANNIKTFVAATGAEAKALVMGMLPAGAEVFYGASKTLEAIGLSQALDEPGKFDSVRNRFKTMDRRTQGREFRKMGAAPDYMLGSVHAVTEQGQVLIASASGSQLAPYASGAGNVIWVVGAQKIVPTAEEGMRRIREYTYPMEDARLRSVSNNPSKINKLLIIYGERPGRITMVIVKEKLGF